ncbi:MAG: hypothetical protein HWE13_11125 [Gammaproteobacteria bacterium]|nr:hypothetical protein [Gammaproteobacteria bacterium]NVK88674.1 hypothetical protein [Gammaproteobacteria bacterium]
MIDTTQALLSIQQLGEAIDPLIAEQDWSAVQTLSDRRDSLLQKFFQELTAETAFSEVGDQLLAIQQQVDDQAQKILQLRAKATQQGLDLRSSFKAAKAYADHR